MQLANYEEKNGALKRELSKIERERGRKQGAKAKRKFATQQLSIANGGR